MDCMPHTLWAIQENALKSEFQLLLLKDPINMFLTQTV